MREKLFWVALQGMGDFWSEAPGTDFRGEGNVELRLVIPLLHALGYDDDDIDAKFPVVFQEGRSGRKHEADFACFHGPLHNRDTSLLVVEAKKPGEALPDGKAQGESYAANLNAPLLLLTNGEALEIWQLRKTQESVRVLAVPVSSLAAERGQIEKLLRKEAVLDYCRSFHVKTILEASADYGRFETAELRRILQNDRKEPSIERTVRQVPEEAQTAPLETDQILSKFPAGAFIVASSGYGKTTLSRRLLRQAIEERQRGNRTKLPFDVPLPDLEQSKVSIIDYMQQRISAHCPSVTTAALTQMLRDAGATILCDGLDRTTDAFQKKIVSEFRRVQRDYPLVQIFVFARTSIKSDLAVPVLALLPLSDEQMRELEKLVLGDGNPIFYSIIGMMPPTLRALCENPLVLRQVLAYWKQHNDFPRRIELIFRSWLDNVLETEPSDFVSTAQREQALQLLAQATVDSPIVRAGAISLLTDHELPPAALNELIGCGAIRAQGATVEVQHEALADYLRASAIASMEDRQVHDLLPSLPIAANSFFPVLLMAHLRTRSLQSALWKRLSEADLGLYIDALRYRFDVSGELERSSPATLSRHYLEDLLGGIELPLNGFFPHLREAVLDGLTGDPSATLAATGLARAQPAALNYKLHAQEPGQDKVTIAAPTFPGILRGVNLDLARYRIDSARLLGITMLRDQALDAVRHQNLMGGPAWLAERLVGRVRYLIEKFNLDLSIQDSFDRLETVLTPLSDLLVDDGPFSRGERFSIQSLLDDIAALRAAGRDALDPWWLGLGWNDAATSQDEETLRRLVNEEYRRVQIIYREIAQAALPLITDAKSYFAALPVRWSFTVVKSKMLSGHFGAYFSSRPVASWDDAGADVAFAEAAIPVSELDWERTRGALAMLGRPNARIPHFAGSMALLPGYDGRQWNGYFDGATPVTHQVCSWLKEEIDRLFAALPGSDGAF